MSGFGRFRAAPALEHPRHVAVVGRSRHLAVQHPEVSGVIRRIAALQVLEHLRKTRLVNNRIYCRATKPLPRAGLTKRHGLRAVARHRGLRCVSAARRRTNTHASHPAGAAGRSPCTLPHGLTLPKEGYVSNRSTRRVAIGRAPDAVTGQQNVRCSTRRSGRAQHQHRGTRTTTITHGDRSSTCGANVVNRTKTGRLARRRNLPGSRQSRAFDIARH